MIAIRYTIMLFDALRLETDLLVNKRHMLSVYE